MISRLLVILAIAHGSVGPCWAQASNVNDCTLLQDPTELRNCILRFEGQRTPPPTTLESGSEVAPPAPVGDGGTATSPSKVDAAPVVPAKSKVDRSKADPANKRPKSGAEGSRAGRASGGRIGEVWVDQINMSPAARSPSR